MFLCGDVVEPHRQGLCFDLRLHEQKLVRKKIFRNNSVPDPTQDTMLKDNTKLATTKDIVEMPLNSHFPCRWSTGEL